MLQTTWAFFLSFFLSITTYSANLQLVEFNTNNYDSLQVYINKIEEKGVMARHIFPPNTVIFEMYKRTDKVFENETTISQTYSSETVGLNKLNTANKVHTVFKNLIQPQESLKSNTVPVPLSGCVEHGILPDSINALKNQQNLSADIQTSVTEKLTGQYLIGSIAVGIYLMESTGSQEDWWAAAEQTTFNEIVEGLDWLSEEALSRDIKVVWVYAPVEKISTNYEPISNKHVPLFDILTLNWVFDWVDDIFSAHGFTDEWDGAFGLANQLRQTYRTNWAVEIAVVMDENDPDHLFSDNKSAYVVSPANGSLNRGPLVVMTYNNGNYQPWRMDYVTAHEVSHVFGTSDEYSSCDCGIEDSYLQTTNGNCEDCNPTPVACYMTDWISGYKEYCDFTAHELGWRDSYDSDGIMDPVDPNSGMFAWINPVAAGDLLRIRNIGNYLVNNILVTEEMLTGQNMDVILWDGGQYDNTIGNYGIYNVSKNGGSDWNELLNFTSTTTTLISNHNYNLDNISYLNNSPQYIRHTIFDSLGNIYSRPSFDVMTNTQVTVNTNTQSFPDGIYTSEVFGWTPYGANSNISTVQFINYVCGDIDNSGAVDIADMEFLVAYMFQAGSAPVHMASGDIECDEQIDIGDLAALVAYMFQNGPAIECCHSL